jgi:hypothetical protein
MVKPGVGRVFLVQDQHKQIKHADIIWKNIFMGKVFLMGGISNILILNIFFLPLNFIH